MLIKPDGMNEWVNTDYIIYAKEKQEGYTTYPSIYLANGVVATVKSLAFEVLKDLTLVSGGIWVNPKYVTSVSLQIDRTAAYQEKAQYAQDIAERFTKVKIDLAGPRPDFYVWAEGKTVQDLDLWARLLSE